MKISYKVLGDVVLGYLLAHGPLEPEALGARLEIPPRAIRVAIARRRDIVEREDGRLAVVDASPRIA